MKLTHHLIPSFDYLKIRKFHHPVILYPNLRYDNTVENKMRKPFSHRPLQIGGVHMDFILSKTLTVLAFSTRSIFSICQ